MREFSTSNSRLKIQTSVSYTLKGLQLDERFDISLGPYPIPTGVFVKVRMYHLEIPFLLRYKFNDNPDKGWYVLFGPYIAFGLFGKVHTSLIAGLEIPLATQRIDFDKGEFSIFDAGVEVGIGYSHNFKFGRLFLDWKNTIGLIEALKSEVTDPLSLSTLNTSFALGYIYTFKSKEDKINQKDSIANLVAVEDNFLLKYQLINKENNKPLNNEKLVVVLHGLEKYSYEERTDQYGIVKVQINPLRKYKIYFQKDGFETVQININPQSSKVLDTQKIIELIPKRIAQFKGNIKESLNLNHINEVFYNRIRATIKSSKTGEVKPVFINKDGSYKLFLDQTDLYTLTVIDYPYEIVIKKINPFKRKDVLIPNSSKIKSDSKKNTFVKNLKESTFFSNERRKPTIVKRNTKRQKTTDFNDSSEYAEYYENYNNREIIVQIIMWMIT